MKRHSLLVVSSLFFLLLANLGLAAPVEASGALKQGMSGSDVAVLQRQLQEYGYYQGEVDGVFGSGTKAAVFNFQVDNDLDTDGVVGPSTLQALHSFKPGSVAASRGQYQSRKGVQLAVFAKQFLGVPYAWGGISPGGFDCSGFIYYICSHFGFDVPRMADGQFEVGQQVSKRDLQIGDLVFFSTYEPGPSHVGIYIGNNQFIHASSAVGEVTITPLSKPYYVERYLGARRLVH